MKKPTTKLSRPRKVNRGIMFGEDVLEYLGMLEEAWGCSRSFLVNNIIRMHAVNSGAVKYAPETDATVVPVIRL